MSGKMEHQRVSFDLVDRLSFTLEEIGNTGGYGDSFEYNLRALLDWVDVHKPSKEVLE